MFYTWLHMAYAVLLCAAMWLNRADWRTFLLSLVVAANLFVPTPWTVNPALWYFECFLEELVVILFALLLRSPTSKYVIVFAVILSVIDLVGVFVGPVKGIGPYRIAEPIFETGEILICVLLSHSARQFFQRRVMLSLLKRE
jgi:hypothetical protein